MISVHMTNPEADGESVGKWPDWVEFTVVDPNGVAIQRVYAEVRGQGGSEAGASAAVTLPPGAYLVWADAVDPDGRFRVASSRVPEPIAVGEATNAAWGASSGSDLGNACFAVAAWRLDSAQPNAQLICLIRDESGVQHVLWATGAEAVALDGGVLAVRGTCSVDGVHKVGFEATTNLSQGTFSLSLSGLWNVAGALDSLVTRVP
jgi:hypothetical protein